MRAIASENRAFVTWSEINVTAVKGKCHHLLLQDVSGYVEPYHSLAVLGPSGSGKTTLLNTLCGRSSSQVKVSGQILVNGSVCKLRNGAVSYVPEVNMLTGTLTVRETLDYTARLRLHQTREERESLVLQVMQDVGLLDSANTRVGTPYSRGLSSGEKRRLSIACELIVGPSLMVLDEPTSGLDAASAYYVVNALEKLSAGGRTIIMSIHQPSAEVFDLFDKLLLLSCGRSVYFGCATEAEKFFEDCGMQCPQHRALADHYLFVLNTQFELEDDCNVSNCLGGCRLPDGSSSSFIIPIPPANKPSKLKSALSSTISWHPCSTTSGAVVRLLHVYQTDIKPHVDTKVLLLSQQKGLPYYGFDNEVSLPAQCVTLTARMMLSAWRDIGSFWPRLLMYFLLCLCLGTVFWRLDKSAWNLVVSRGTLMFFTVAFVTLMAVSGFPTFVKDTQVFNTERRNGVYGVTAYSVASTISSLPFLIIITLVCSPLAYFMAGLNSDPERFAYFVLTLFLCLVVVESLMMAFSAIVQNFFHGLAGGLGFLVIWILISGYIVPTSEIPRVFWYYPMHFLSVHTYAIHGLMRNEFSGTDGWGCPCKLQERGCADPNCTLTGEQVLQALDFHEARSKTVDVVAMVMMAVGYRAMFFCMLKMRSRWLEKSMQN